MIIHVKRTGSKENVANYFFNVHFRIQILIQVKIYSVDVNPYTKRGQLFQKLRMIFEWLPLEGRGIKISYIKGAQRSMENTQERTEVVTN